MLTHRHKGRDPYRVLGIDNDTPLDEVKRVFRKAAHACHPDRNPKDPMADSRFSLLRWAYESVLADLAPELSARADLERVRVEVRLPPNRLTLEDVFGYHGPRMRMRTSTPVTASSPNAVDGVGANEPEAGVILSRFPEDPQSDAA